MPHFIVRGISPEQMRSISKRIIEDAAQICECGTDNFTIECLHTTSVFDGQITASFPFIEVTWFERGQEIRDRLADSIYGHVRSLGIAEVETAFIAYREDNYYINGKRFGK